MKMRLILILAILSPLIFLFSCPGWGDRVDDLPLYGSVSETQKIIKGVSFTVKVSASTMRNSSLNIRLYIEPNDSLVFYPSHLKILTEDMPLEYKLYSCGDFKIFKASQVMIRKIMKCFDYSALLFDLSGRTVWLQEGEKIKIFGEKLIECNGEFYDLDTLTFYVSKNY